MPNPVASIARNEIKVTASSPRWASVWALFGVLSVASYAELVSGQTSQFVVVPIMGSTFYFFELGLPLIGVIMGFDLISEDLESNRLSLILSHPLSRLHLYLGKFLARFTLIVAPLLLASMLLTLIFAGPLNVDLVERFVVAILALMLGALFWLGLSSAISAIVRKSMPALVYSFSAVFLFAYQPFNLIPIAVLSVIMGRVVIPGEGFPYAPIYLMQLYGNELVPGDQVVHAYTLFQSGPFHGFAVPSIVSWFLGGANEGGIPGLPVYGLVAYLGLLTFSLVLTGAYML